MHPKKVIREEILIFSSSNALQNGRKPNQLIQSWPTLWLSKERSSLIIYNMAQPDFPNTDHSECSLFELSTNIKHLSLTIITLSISRIMNKVPKNKIPHLHTKRPCFHTGS